MRRMNVIGGMLAFALVAFLVAPGASAGGKEVSDTEAASLYGGACDVQSILPNTMPWCGPTGACGTVQVPVDIGTTDKITVAVQCGNSMNCNVYPIQIDRCGT
jgi:hypothetical protein